jgi:hypothetical protein
MMWRRPSHWHPFIPSEVHDGVESGRGAGRSSEVGASMVGISVGSEQGEGR